jgi:hypothetical protein
MQQQKKISILNSIIQQELFVQVHEWIMGEYKLRNWIILFITIVYHTLGFV